LRPTVSVIIPSLTGVVDATVETVRSQAYSDWELVVVSGVRPAARARNDGRARAKGDLLLFLDDDARLGHPGVMTQLVRAMENPDVAVAGTSKVLPSDANSFQRRVAAEVPRWIFPILDQPLESNPPTTRYGFSAATTTCCLIRRDAIERVGGFNEQLSTGEDTELFFRLRSAGYRFVVPAQCWVYHPPPATIRALLRKSFAYGVGNGLEARLAPDRHMDVVHLDRWWGKLLLFLAPVLLLPSVFVSLYLDPRVRVRVGIRPIKAIATFATLYGYAWGWFRSRG
jgi:glycosyltransferase involved in cell wall biosynthesis